MFCIYLLMLLWVTPYKASCLFFHEASVISITPGSTGASRFGFALGFQKGLKNRLVITDPAVDDVGKVYTCPVTTLEDRIKCSAVNIDLEALAPSNRSISPSQKNFLGTSIAATSDYFLTCAPMWINEIKKNSFAYGMCIVYDEIAHKYVGVVEQLSDEVQNKFKPIHYQHGGVGFNVLTDDKNGYILIAKSGADAGDIQYLPMKNALQPVDTLFHGNPLPDNFKDYMNTGYGLAAGNFFSEKTVYAFSMQVPDFRAFIWFVEVVNGTFMLMTKNTPKDPFAITSRDIGAMFGYAMTAADLNKDGLSELIVGAPAHRNIEDEPENGAVHLYLGGDINTCNSKNRRRTIYGNVDGGRFGSVLATSDIDGDSIAEIFIAAPYEGSGVVYVLSGFEVKEKLFHGKEYTYIEITNLRRTQKIQPKTSQQFGFSILPLDDFDQNGGGELAIGSPSSNTVMLYRSIQVITVTISQNLIGTKIVREQDNKFSVNVCVHVGYNLKSKHISGSLSVNNKIYGNGVTIKNPSFKVDLTKKENQTCKPIDVTINDYDPGIYNFETIVKIDRLEEKLNNTDFDKGMVLESPYSRMSNSFDVTRSCKDEDCEPKLDMKIEWFGGTSNKSLHYKVGSSRNESVRVVVSNSGANADGACVVVKMSHAYVNSIPCSQEGDKGYRCQLSKPLKRNSNSSITISLDMTKMTNKDDKLFLEALLFANCQQQKINDTKSLNVIYDLESGKVNVYGKSQDLEITKSELEIDKTLPFTLGHVYRIENRGWTEWLGLKAIIEVYKAPFDFVADVSLANTACQKVHEDATSIKYQCPFNLDRVSEIVAIVNVQVKSKVMKNYLKPDTSITKVKSTLYLNLTGTTDVSEKMTKSLESKVVYNQNVSFWNNRPLVILVVTIVALLILALLSYGLYKVGFFKKQEKKKLDDLRSSLIRKNKGQESAPKKNNPEDNQVEVPVADDCVFEEINGESSCTRDSQPKSTVRKRTSS